MSAAKKKSIIVTESGNCMKFLRKLRIDRGLSRAKAVRLMRNVSEGTLQYWEEKAKDMSFDAACQIAKAYGISLEELRILREQER